MAQQGTSSSANAMPGQISSHTYKGVELCCVVGSIIDCQVDGIGVSCDATYALSAGVGKAVKQAAGTAFLKNLEIAKAAAGTRGGAICVDVGGGGSMKATKIVLVPLRNSDRNMMQLIYGQLFYKAQDSGLKSIAVPCLGTGAFGIPSSEAAEFMVDAIAACPNFGSLKVVFMDINTGAMQAFSSAIKGLASGDKSRTTSRVAGRKRGRASADPHPASSANDGDGGHPFYAKVTKEELALIRKGTQSKDKGTNEESDAVCSVCLCELFDEGSEYSLVRLRQCDHYYHQECIDAAFKSKPQCPLCMKWYSAATGDQPIGATMTVRTLPGALPGFSDTNSYYEILYSIPSGTQTETHIRPGKHFSGTTRIAYLPVSADGSLVLRLLQKAFDRRLIFTVGDSVTSGARDTVVWNNIHHKTSIGGGPQCFGYPDDDYLRRVKEELAQKGIVKEMLDEDT